jgi:hypothetical protein
MSQAQLATRFQHTSGLVQSSIPLTDGEIQRAAPSVFADSPHGSRSSRYVYIPTSDVLKGLRESGFQPFFACQARCRTLEKESYTKHLLRLRHVEQITGSEANEIILVNSHDGSSSYQMLAGVFRFVCHNGLICGETVEDLRIRHSGQIVGNVIEGAFRILNHFDEVDAARESMQALTLKPTQQLALADAALNLRYDAEEHRPIEPEQVNTPRRFEDRGNDLWTTFNRIQENLMRGGLSGHNRNGRRLTTRPIAGVSENVRLNRALWTLTERMAQLLN